ncbi:MAG: hypothetical protein JJU24_02220 [Natronohydrobacter sp.]|nr:hypothetical protein [Natronohydrobacter sp.]
MPKSRLFALKAQRAAVEAQALARDMLGLAQQAEKNREMQGRIDVFLESLLAPVMPLTVADLRARAELAASLVSEQERQQRLETEARTGAQDLISDLQYALRQKRHAAQAAEQLQRQEAATRLKRHELSTTAPGNNL